MFTEKEYLSTKAAAEILGVSAKTLELWRKKNEGPDFFKIGGRYYYQKGDLFTFLSFCKKIKTKPKVA